MTNCSTISTVLEIYELGSRQLVNLEKSVFCCSPNLSEDLSGLLGIPHTDESKSYLGIPARTGRHKMKIFSHITSRVLKQLLAWRAIIFSAGGRQVLVKAVTQAILTYSMSQASVRFYRWASWFDSSVLVGRYWGKFIGNIEILSLDRRVSADCGLKNWETLIVLSLVVKLGVSFIFRNAITAQVIKAKLYHPHMSILDLECKAHFSYMCKSLCSRLDIVLSGVRWQVGERSMRVFQVF